MAFIVIAVLLMMTFSFPVSLWQRGQSQRACQQTKTAASTIERTFSLLIEIETEGNRAYSDPSAFLVLSQLFNRHLLHIGYKPHSTCIARSCIREKTENFDDAKSCRQTEKTETSPHRKMTPF